MIVKWGSCAILALCLATLVGCRTPTPNLKPPKAEEVYTTPPTGGQYDTPGYPKQAFEKMEDPALKLMDQKNGVMPQRGGSTMPAGMPGNGNGRY
jgi:hypothetical protein